MAKKPISTVAVVPDAWRRIAEQEKTLVGWPEWSVVAALPNGPRVRTPRGQLTTAAAETTDAVVQLAGESGIGLEGVRFRLKAWAFRRNEDVTATLEVLRGSKFVAIGRVDAWPCDPHMNTHKARKMSGLKHLPAVIENSHVHRFSDNAKYGMEGFGPGPEGNLPAAVEILNKLGSFRDFLRVVSEEFHISGLDDVLAPQSWQVML